MTTTAAAPRAKSFRRSLVSFSGPALVSLACSGEAPATGEADAGAGRSGAGSSAAAPQGSASAAASAAQQKHPLAGAWRGTYEAKKTAVSLDPDVKDKEWAADDGSKHSGKGDIDVRVAEDGTATGVVKGPLGEGTLVGFADGERLTASLVPADPSSEGAMTGTLDAQHAKDEIGGTLRASSAAGTIVREAQVKLTRAK